MRKKVKVAHITTVAMGQKYLVLNQMKHYRDAGYEVIGISAPGHEISALRDAGIRHIAVPFNRRPFTPFADIVSLISLCKVLAAEKPTIVHTHNPKPTLYAQLAARLVGVPVVVNTLHGYIFQDENYNVRSKAFVLLERLAARWADAILSVNSEDVQTALREGIADLSKISHLGGGVDLSRFDPSKMSSDKREIRESIGLCVETPVVGFVGRLVREKGILNLLGAAKKVLRQNPETKFLIIGSTDLEKKDSLAPSVASEFGLEKSVIFLGHRDDTPSLYSCMDLLVLPSHREGLPLAPMEASAMGIPSIVTDIRGCREVIRNDVNGLVVPKEDDSSLAAAICTLLNNPIQARAYGAKAREIALEEFDERRVIGKVLNTYERLLMRKTLNRE